MVINLMEMFVLVVFQGIMIIFGLSGGCNLDLMYLLKCQYVYFFFFIIGRDLIVFEVVFGNLILNIFGVGFFNSSQKSSVFVMMFFLVVFFYMYKVVVVFEEFKMVSFNFGLFVFMQKKQ